MKPCVQCQRGNHGAACIRWSGCGCEGALCGTAPELKLELRADFGSPVPFPVEKKE
mgnify:FL=1